MSEQDHDAKKGARSKSAVGKYSGVERIGGTSRPGRVSSASQLAPANTAEAELASRLQSELTIGQRQLEMLEAARADRRKAEGQAWILRWTINSVETLIAAAHDTDNGPALALVPVAQHFCSNADATIAKQDLLKGPSAIADNGLQGNPLDLSDRDQTRRDANSNVGRTGVDANHILGGNDQGYESGAGARPGSFTISAKGDGAGEGNAVAADMNGFVAKSRAHGGTTRGVPSASVTDAVPFRSPAANQATPTTQPVTDAPTPIVRVDQKATTKKYAREYVTADEFLALWATELLDVTMKNLGPTPATPHARLRWIDADNAAVLIAASLDMSRGRFGTDDRSLLLRLFYPLDLHALIDRYRDLRPPPPGHEGDGPTGTSAWQTAIGDSIAAEARPRLNESIHRMGQRYVAAADSLYASGTRAETAIKAKLAAENAILPHTPLDYLVLFAMRDPNVVAYTPPTAKAPREHANGELRPLSITCMGERDPTLWNVVRIDTPGTTVEQVAAALFNRGDDATAHTYDADLIVDAAPFYIIPKEWAATVNRINGRLGTAAYEPKADKRQRELSRYNPEATRRAAAQAASDPRTLLVESALADEMALAQNDVATQRQAAEASADKKHNARKDDAGSETMLAVDAMKVITRARGQLDYLHEVMAPWSLDKSVVTAAGFMTRVEEKSKRSDVLNSSWSSLLARSGRLLSQVSEQVASFVKEVGKPATAGGDPNSPIGRVLAKYASAAGASHHVGSGSALLAEAERARQGVLLSTIELAVQSSGYAVSQERANEDYARDVDGDSLHLDDTQQSVRMRAAQMRNALAQGKSVEASEAEELILEAEENRLVATISTLKVQLREFKSEADKGTLGILPGFVQSTELLNMRLNAPFLISELDSIHAFLNDGHKIIYGPRSSKDVADPSLPDVATRKRENLRQFVQSAHTKLEALKQEQHIEDFLQRADQVLADQRWRVMVGTAAAMIGVGLVTGGVASFVGGAVRGAMLLDLAADAAGLVKTVRIARAFGTAAELVTDATLSGVAQSALVGGDTAIGENILSNALTRFALSPIGRLTAGLGEVDKKALDAWQRVGHGAQFVLGKGIQLSAEMLTGTAISYAVHRIASWKRGEQPSDEMVDSWLLQGASFAVGRFLNGRLHHRMQQLDKFGQRVGRLPQRMGALAERASHLEHTGTPQEAIDLLLEHRHIVDEEIKTIAKLEKEGVIRPHEADALRADADADGNVIKTQGFVAIQARAAGLEPVVEGAGRWSGDAVEIMTMMGKASSLGLDVQIIQHGNSQTRWRVRFGAEILEFDERVSRSPKKPADLSQEESASVRQWAGDLANSNTKKMTPEAAAADREAYANRVGTVADMYEKAMAGEIATPNGVSKERLTQAVKGGSDGERVPLTYGADPTEAKRTFHQLQAELQALLDSEGITDAVIVQLGSGTTGWSTAPGKTGKAWSSKSDVDFAIFSDQILAQARAIGAKINPKNKIGDQYTTLRNTQEGKHSFEYTPVGAKLKRLAQDWNRRIYGRDVPDGFDFKINLQTDHPFRNAVPVVQMETPVPLTSGKAGGTHAIEIEGRTPYLGVPVQSPKMAGRLPVKSVGRREFHITVLSPPELAALPAAKRAELARGVDIPGRPRGRSMERNDIGDMASFQMEVEWPEAQAFRQQLGLSPKDLHVSLNGGIGKAIEARNANASAQSQQDSGTTNGGSEDGEP